MTYLKSIRNSRYEKGISPEEDSLNSSIKFNVESIDKYAFGILVEELLKKKTQDEIPHLLDFKDYCRKNLQNSNPENRSDLSEVLIHPFFNHNFIKIFKFLLNLPLKTNDEKDIILHTTTFQPFQVFVKNTDLRLSYKLLNKCLTNKRPSTTTTTTTISNENNTYNKQTK